MTAQASGEWMELTASDGHRLSAFRVAPGGAAAGTVVVVQEIFGVNRHIQGICRRVAAEGYLAIAPALFDRVRSGVELPYDATGIQEGRALKDRIGFDLPLIDIAAALALSGPEGAATMGFCYGGSLAWLAAARLQTRGSIAYYGGQIGAYLDAAPRVPTMTHFGTEDASIPMAVVDALAARYPTVVTHRYRAGHGFHCDERGSYHAGSAAAAWTRTTGFLRAIF